MSRVPTIKLSPPDGNDFVIVEPGSSADKIWRARGYSDKQVSEPARGSEENIQSVETLFPKKKRPGRPKKMKDLGKNGYEKT